MTRALTVGVFTSIPLTASGGTKPYTYSIISGLPAGLTLNASTGVISGTPTTAQTSTAIAWQVEDALAATATDSFNVVVQAVPVAVPHYRFLVELAGLFRLRGALAVANLEPEATVGLALGGIGVGAAVAVDEPEATVGIALGGIAIGVETEAVPFATVGIALGGIGVGVAVAVDIQPEATVGIALGGIGVGVEAALTPWTPAELSPRFWLESFDSATLFDATSGGSLPANGGQIARWEDKSGNAFHVTQATSGNRPLRTTSSLNGNDGVTFDGTNDWIENASATFGLANRTLFIVFKENVAKASAGIVVIKPTGSQNDFGNAGVTSQGYLVSTSDRTTERFQIGGSNFSSEAQFYRLADTTSPATIHPPVQYCEVKSGTSATLYRNGSSVVTDSSYTAFSATSAGGINLGARYIPSIAGPYLNGVIYGVVYVESALSTDDRQRLEGYFAHELGTTADLPGGHPYKTAPPYL